MNIKRILSLAVAVAILASVMTFTGCDILNQFLGDETEKPGAGVNTLVMEAEYIDIDDVAGAGISNNNSGLSMIYGDGTDAQKEMWSNGYYVGYTHNDNTVLEFVFNSTEATTANIVLMLGSELKDITLTPENFAVVVNGVDQVGYSWFIEYSDMSAAEFTSCRLSSAVNLVKGENKIVLKVLNNDLGGADGATRGPLVDCIKVTATDAELSWTPHTDNPERRDSEV